MHIKVWFSLNSLILKWVRVSWWQASQWDAIEALTVVHSLGNGNGKSHLMSESKFMHGWGSPHRW
jgi:hypothetical protein